MREIDVSYTYFKIFKILETNSVKYQTKNVILKIFFNNHIVKTD